jgi:hypothetical protein
VLILKGVKALCFDTLLEVFILKGVREECGVTQWLLRLLEGLARFPGGVYDRISAGLGWVGPGGLYRGALPRGGGWFLFGRGKSVADDVAPGVGAEGVDVFILGERDGLDEGLGEIAEGGGGFRIDLALSDGGEEVAQSGGQIAGGEIAMRESGGDLAANLLSGQGFGFLTGVESTERLMGGVAW